MKRNKFLTWSFILAMPVLLSVMGCKKFLDRKPLTATLDDLNQGTLEAQIFGMYSTLGFAGFSTLPWIDFHSIRDDDAQKGSSSTDGAEINTQFETFQYSKDDWAPNTYWNDHYTMINLANKAIYFADSLKFNDPASLRNIGEARFFRAYSFFELVKTYGEVPLINFYFTNASDGIRPKATLPALYAQIDEDLSLAAQYLPQNWKVANVDIYPGRLTNGAAKTLWAQTYLFRQNWAKVKQLCNEVIATNEYSLMPTFPEVWKDGLNGAGKNSKESIWEMQANIGANGTNNNGSNWGTCQNVRQGGTTNVWNLGWGWNTPTQKLETAWPADDPRKRQTILYSGQSDGGPAEGGYGAVLPAFAPGPGLDQPFWNKKVYSDPQMRQFTGQIFGNGGAGWINHRILRYADVILMLAEAANETNDGPTAEANLEKIRLRASGLASDPNHTRTKAPFIAYVNQTQMRQAIKNERRWEFAMEGYRFYDLVRWGDAIAELGALGYTNRCRYYPIPQKAIDLTGGVLKQNPEW